MARSAANISFLVLVDPIEHVNLEAVLMEERDEVFDVNGGLRRDPHRHAVEAVELVEEGEALLLEDASP